MTEKFAAMFFMKYQICCIDGRKADFYRVKLLYTCAANMSNIKTFFFKHRENWISFLEGNLAT